MKNDRESRQSLCYFFEYVETQWRRYEYAFFVSCALCRCELVCPVGSSDCDSQRIAACSAYEFFNFFRSCITLVSGFYDYFVLYSGECSELSLDYYAMSVSIIYYLLCYSDILLEWLQTYRSLPK